MSGEYDVCLVAYEEEAKQGEKSNFASFNDNETRSKAMIVFEKAV